MAKIKAEIWEDRLRACLTHKRVRSYRTRVSEPKNKCVICWLCWLADRTDNTFYEDDVVDLIKFATKADPKTEVQFHHTKAKD